jgi:pseudaminic acid biosynthesis-associated methylase
MNSQKSTKQLEVWRSTFGKEYTDRHTLAPEEMDSLLGDYYAGVKKTDLFRQFLSPERIPSGKVLEVGCNVGIQLRMLRLVNPALEMYGIEPQSYAVAKARELDSESNFLPGNAFDLPFKDGLFEVVMTNGVLIHVHPSDLPTALAEICRCSRRFIFCHEYYSESPRELHYRGHDALLWKMNYLEEYLKVCPDLRTVEERYLTYPDPDGGPDLVDQVFLLEKGHN